MEGNRGLRVRDGTQWSLHLNAIDTLESKNQQAKWAGNSAQSIPWWLQANIHIHVPKDV